MRGNLNVTLKSSSFLLQGLLWGPWCDLKIEDDTIWLE